jgi:hypothetical protein
MWYGPAYGVSMAKQKPKDKGTEAETDVVNWARKHDFYKAERLALHGTGDKGDVRMAEGVMVQVKNGYTDKISNGVAELKERREPTDFQIAKWLEETEGQRRRGEFKYALLTHKRFGKADPDDWRWYMDGPTLANIMGYDALGDKRYQWPPYVQLQGYMIPPLLKNAGIYP